MLSSNGEAVHDERLRRLVDNIARGAPDPPLALGYRSVYPLEKSRKKPVDSPLQNVLGVLLIPTIWLN